MTKILIVDDEADMRKAMTMMLAMMTGRRTPTPAPAAATLAPDSQKFIQGSPELHDASVERGLKIGARFWAVMERDQVRTLSALWAVKFIHDNLRAQVIRCGSMEAWEAYKKVLESWPELDAAAAKALPKEETPS